VKLALDNLVIGWVMQNARESVKRGDVFAAESAFCSEMAGDSEYAHYFPWLRVTRKERR
jgi:hypothetical protein